MQRFWWPGYEMQLLRELQRQQNSAQFCDTLLQTEGISVPTHSCVLAALSPYLSQKLSASPSPPSGQRHRLQLPAVKAQTLLKLVGLLYSGELEVKGSREQNDVLAVARQFGIADLAEGQKDRGTKEAELQEKRQCLGSWRENGFHTEETRGKEESRKMRDAQVQAEMAGRSYVDSPVEQSCCISKGTQTVKAAEKSDGSFITTPLTPESAHSKAKSLDFSVMFQPQSITLNKQFCSTSCPVITSTPSSPSGAESDGESTLNHSIGTVINSTSTPALCSDMLTLPISLNGDSQSPRHQEDGTYQQPSEFGESIQGLAKDRTELVSGTRNGTMADNRADTEQLSLAGRDEIAGREVQQMTETTQISIKLRRTTKGEVWEVVNIQDMDETLSVLTSLKQDCPKNKRPETDFSNVPAPPSTVQSSSVLKPDSCILQPATTNSKSSPHPNTSSDSPPPSSDCLTRNQKGLEAAPLLQHQGSVEESDEQIEKLLEDIMMGLDILPSLERDFKTFHHLQLSHNGVPTISQAPVTPTDAGHSQINAVFYQDFGTQSFNSSADTAQVQPSCSSLSSVSLDAALIQQQQEHSPQCHSYVRSMWQRDGKGNQGVPLSISHECLYPETTNTRPGIPSASFSVGQKLHYPEFQEHSSQDTQQNLEFLPLMNVNEAQSMDALSLPSMDDLLLPHCLSPLKPSTSETKHEPALINPVSSGNKIQQQLSVNGRPWLTGNPISLQFPLRAITRSKNKRGFLPQDTNCSRWSKQSQEHLELNPQNKGTRAEPCTAKEVKERKKAPAGQQNAAGLKSDRSRMKECDHTGEVIAPKRRKMKCTSCPQNAADSPSAYKTVKVSDGTKSHINLSICQVSLSSNNVLVKEKEMATGSSNISSKNVRKQNQLSSVTESLREKSTGSGVYTDQTRIGTRGFLKKSLDSPGDTSPKKSLVKKPVARRAKTVNKQRVTSSQRGRPSKTKHGVLTPPNNSPAVKESQQKMEYNLPKEDLEKGEEMKRRCKRGGMNRSAEVVGIPQKKTVSVKSHGKPDRDSDKFPDVRNFQRPEWPKMVNLKVFQNLIKRQHSKTRKSKESQGTNEIVSDTGSEGIASIDNICKETTKETEMDIDISHPQDRGGSEGSQVIFHVTVDKNHNLIFKESTGENNVSQLDKTGSSTRKETSVLSDEDHPMFSIGVLEEEVDKLASEREQPLKSPDEAETTCDTGEPNTTQQTAFNDEGLSHKLPSDYNLHPETPERTGPPLSDAVGISRTSGCDQEEEEQEEEVEVDVLLYSPIKVPQTSVCEDGPNNTEISPDEEEEEDVNVTDVTGDEAE